MEAWSFINKTTNEIIRFDIRTGDIEFGDEYYFTVSLNSPLWFVHSEEIIKKTLTTYEHPQFNIFFETPSKSKINIDNYKIAKFVFDD